MTNLDNKELEEAILNLKEAISKNEPIVEYLKLKKIVNGPYFAQRRNEIEFYKSCSKSSDDRTKYNELKKTYENNVEIKEFKIIEKETNDFFEEIKSILDVKL